jgi:hypothetical protein
MEVTRQLLAPVTLPLERELLIPLVGPRGGLNAMKKRKYLAFDESRTPAGQLVAHSYND